jgi:hypothetical protein
VGNPARSDRRAYRRAGNGDEVFIAPVILGAGKRLFDGFGESLELEHLGVRQSPFATFIGYRLKSAGGES